MMNEKIMKTHYRFLLITAAVALVMFCSSPVASSAAQSVEPIPVRILMLIPDDFNRYSYTSSFQERETHHPFGKEAEEQFRKLLVPEFQSMVIKSISTEAAAIDMLTPDNSKNDQLRGYDYVAIPKFTSVNSLHKRSQYRYEIEMLIEFYATDRSTLTRAKGYGESTTGAFVSTTPRDAANLALRNAVEAIRDGIEQKRWFFPTVPGPAPLPVATSQHEEDTTPSVTPLPAKVLLLIPEEFGRFVYTSSIEGAETRHAFGEEAQKQFGRFLVPEFQSVVIKTVGSETAALDMISPDSLNKAEVQGYDYIAIPRFSDVSSWRRQSGYGFDVDVVLEFYSTGTARDVKIKGYGEFSTGLHGPSTPLDAGRSALRSAISAISQKIDRRRDLFTSP